MKHLMKRDKFFYETDVHGARRGYQICGDFPVDLGYTEAVSGSTEDLLARTKHRPTLSLCSGMPSLTFRSLRMLPGESPDPFW
jgi:hypothetical protein